MLKARDRVPLPVGRLFHSHQRRTKAAEHNAARDRRQFRAAYESLRCGVSGLGRRGAGRGCRRSDLGCFLACGKRHAGTAVGLQFVIGGMRLDARAGIRYASAWLLISSGSPSSKRSLADGVAEEIAGTIRFGRYLSHLRFLERSPLRRLKTSRPSLSRMRNSIVRGGIAIFAAATIAADASEA